MDLKLSGMQVNLLFFSVALAPEELGLFIDILASFSGRAASFSRRRSSVQLLLREVVLSRNHRPRSSMSTQLPYRGHSPLSMNISSQSLKLPSLYRRRSSLSMDLRYMYCLRSSKGEPSKSRLMSGVLRRLWGSEKAKLYELRPELVAGGALDSPRMTTNNAFGEESFATPPSH